MSMRILPAAVLMVIGLGLAACSNTRTDRPAFEVMTNMLKPGASVAATDSQQISAGVGDTLRAVKGPLSLATFEKTNNNVVLRQISTNGAYRVWAGAGTTERRNITTKNGILTSTRGLRNDLMSSDIDQSLALISARRDGTATRVQRYLDGEDLIYEVTATCTVNRNGQTRVQVGEINQMAQEMVETCQTGSRSYRNMYHVNSSGRVLQSVQWLNDFYGITVIQQLR